MNGLFGRDGGDSDKDLGYQMHQRLMVEDVISSNDLLLNTPVPRCTTGDDVLVIDAKEANTLLASHVTVSVGVLQAT